MATVECHLDPWEWQDGGDLILEVDAEDFEGVTDEQIAAELYRRVWDEAQNHLHFVLPNQETAIAEIKAELSERT